MSSLHSVKRSRPYVHQLYLIQWLQSRQFSAPSLPSSTSSLPVINASSASINNNNQHRNRKNYGRFLRWISGIATGSSLGLLYWSAATSSSSFPFNCGSLPAALFNKQSSSFAECSTATTASESAVDDRRSASGFQKLSLPYYRSAFDAYRRKIFFKYEKRMRLRSPPEKVFEYFASYRSPTGELLMRPVDFMRAVVPVFPPSESNLVRGGYLIGERRPGDLQCAPSEFFMLFDVDNDGLISFKEYIFFVTLLSIPESSFSVAFKMFDIDNSGEIDIVEFKKVMALMRAHNRQGAVHRDGLRTGLKVNGSVDDGGLVGHFFGKDGKEALQHDKFVQFMRDLNDEILRLEFAYYDYKLQGTILAKDFAVSMVASADMSHLDKFLAQVDKLDNEAHLRDVLITFEEFKSFAELRKKLLPFSLALFSYGKVNGLLTRDDFQRAATHVCGVPLTTNVIDIIFHVFDSNHDGNLSTDEFVRVLHRREQDIAQPVESGFMGFLSCCFNWQKTAPLNRFPDSHFGTWAP
uniref:EF-hand domain-containing protein n=1 Tax=Rhizophora mucronata TaxID=61149 RepID=A0A2P2Q354_RHIMU